MSEEEKQIMNKMIYCNLINGEQAIKFNRHIEQIQQENKQLKDLYRKTCEHLFNIGNDELARYFQAQILECPVFTPQVLGDKENE